MRGKVKWYNVKKGYGFVAGDDQEDYFVHFSAMPEGARLNEGDDVTFEPHDTDKGKQARNVTLGAEGEADNEQGQEAESEVSEDQDPAGEEDDQAETDDSSEEESPKEEEDQAETDDSSEEPEGEPEQASEEEKQ